MGGKYLYAIKSLYANLKSCVNLKVGSCPNNDKSVQFLFMSYSV